MDKINYKDDIRSFKRYTVIDHKKDVESLYHKWEWELAFVLIYLAGVGAGIFFTYKVLI